MNMLSHGSFILSRSRCAQVMMMNRPYYRICAASMSTLRISSKTITGEYSMESRGIKSFGACKQIASLSPALLPQRQFTFGAPKWLSSSSYTSPLDEVFDPNAPCPLYGTPKSAPLKKPVPKFLECGISEDVLRFKTVHYGELLREPFIHTNEHRVVLLVDIKHLPLDDVGKKILEQVVGHSRYNAVKGELKMNSVHFPSRIENKRYLVRMFDKLILSCQRLSKSLSMDAEGEGGAVEDVAKNILGESGEAV